MDNLEKYCCFQSKLDCTKIGKIVTYSYDEGITCLLTDKGYIVTYSELRDEYEKIYKGFSDEAQSAHYIKYLNFYDSIFIACDYEFIIFDIRTEQITIRLPLENKILALSWNPGESAVVTVDNKDNVNLFMYSGTSVILEEQVSLAAEVPDHVFVGWGVQKAQFQGSKKRKETEALKVREVENLIFRGPPQISWRGNGEMFVINFIKDDKRYIKVFGQNLNALYESTSFPNLTPPIAFMGQGQYIACCASDNVTNRLVIFEKNCKLKEVYEIPETKGEVQRLQYHPEKNILAIHTRDTVGNSYINIYVYSNAKWFLKQQIYYPPEQTVYSFQWSMNQMNILTSCKLVVFTNKSIEYHMFRFIISRSNAFATAGIINGNDVELYIYDKNIIPTPLHDLCFQHSYPINNILFHPTEPYFLYVDSKLQLGIVQFTRESFTTVLSTNEFTLHNFNYLYAKWIGINIEVTLQCESIQETKNLASDSSPVILSIQFLHMDPTKRIYNLPYNDSDNVDSHRTFEYGKNNYVYLTSSSCSDSEADRITYALGMNRELYVNDDLILDGVTSLYISGKYLLFTHVTSRLYCVRLDDNPQQLDKKLDLTSIFSRSIEQGGRIVTCNNGAVPPQVIMFMPRGTFETVGCKLMTIDAIDEMLSQNKWALAIETIRNERVNWNVLIDLDPHRFCKHIEDFVKAAKSLVVLSYIVNEFDTKHNCFETFYKNYWPKSTNVQYTTDKVLVVGKILEYLLGTDCISNLPCIVAIQQKHVSLHEALNSIRDIYRYDPIENNVLCCNVIKQVLHQENFKDVLNETYKLFDTDFLLLVYQNSSEDPIVYQPHISQLNGMDEAERRYEMSLRANDMKSAGIYMLRCQRFTQQDIETFISKNKLEKHVYDSITRDNSYFGWLSKLFAKRLSLTQNYCSAGMILKRAGFLQEALDMYIRANDRQEVILLMNLLNLDMDKRQNVIDTLATNLAKVNRVDESALILEIYNKDYTKAVQLLIEHKCFRKALCLAQTHKLTDGVENEIQVALKTHINVLLERIEKITEQFGNHRNRLEIVRQGNAMKQERIAQGLYDAVDDLYSESGSTTSGSSRRTSRSRGSTASSRNRRKEERKKIDLREGGFYEDIALVRALHLLCSEIHNLGCEVSDICLIADHEDYELPKTLYRNLINLQSDMIHSAKEIWPDIFTKASTTNDPAELAIIGNRNDLDTKYWTPPSDLFILNWHLELF